MGLFWLCFVFCRAQRRILWLGHAHSAKTRLRRDRKKKSLIRNSLCINAQKSSNPINSSNPTHENVRCCSDEEESNRHPPRLHELSPLKPTAADHFTLFFIFNKSHTRLRPALLCLLCSGFLWRTAQGRVFPAIKKSSHIYSSSETL